MLVAYVVAAAGVSLTIAELRAFLAARLPEDVNREFAGIYTGFMRANPM